MKSFNDKSNKYIPKSENLKRGNFQALCLSQDTDETAHQGTARSAGPGGGAEGGDGDLVLREGLGHMEGRAVRRLSNKGHKNISRSWGNILVMGRKVQREREERKDRERERDVHTERWRAKTHVHTCQQMNKQ